MAKISRPEVALQFLNPAPEKIVQKLLEAGKISALESQLAQKIPMCDSLCVECDSGGHTDNGMPYALVPTMIRLRDDVMKKMNYPKLIYVGTAGGIGTPEAVAASFLMGADFILTGSINQCSPQAGNSDMVKDMLAEANIQDCEMAPAGDMFEIGARVQVFRKGVFFPARANKLYELYKQYNSIEEIDAKTLEQIQKEEGDYVAEEIKGLLNNKNPKLLSPVLSEMLALSESKSSTSKVFGLEILLVS
jgi:trans-AT polyketide synthase/acyltransferase/oxidoreductase domain-containing protein